MNVRRISNRCLKRYKITKMILDEDMGGTKTASDKEAQNGYNIEAGGHRNTSA